MKIRYLIMFKLILSLFGCKKAPETTSTFQALGPFTVETITQKGTYYNINSGRSKYTRISYAVTYKEQPLQFGDKLETNTGLPGIWRIFLLKEASKPALILGSQSLYLVTEENDQAVIKPLIEQGSDFASLQWLDSEKGQPGTFREVYSSDEVDKEPELTGGRYLAITHAVVLDTKTLNIYPFNKNNEAVEGYYAYQNVAIAFAPDSTQVVFFGYKQSKEDYSKDKKALLVYDFKNGTSYPVPYDLKDLLTPDPSEIYLDLFNDYFEWTRTDQHSFRLQLKKVEKLPYRKGHLIYERYQGYKYVLNPVTEPMMLVLADFVREKTGLQEVEMVHSKEEYENKIAFTYQNDEYLIQYGEYGSDLALRCKANVQDQSKNKLFVMEIGKTFNALLNSGRYQALFMNAPAEDQ